MPCNVRSLLKEGRSHALASGFRSYVEVFDAGEEGACRDVGAVGEDGHAEYLAFGSGGKYVYVSGFDGLAQFFGEGFGDGFAVSEGRFEERQGFGDGRG